MKATVYTMAVIGAQTAAFSMAKPFVAGRTVLPMLRSSTTTTSLALSPATVGGLLTRGGASEVVLKSFYGDALGFFGGIRTPATFLAGSSLAAIFTLKNAANSLSSNEEVTKLERRVIKFYHLVSLLAFVLSLNTIITATGAHTAVLHGRFNQMAETAYMMMKTEFEYEFVMVRWSFLVAIFCFLGMVTSRVLIEFGLLKQDCAGSRKDVAMMVMCSLGALAANLLSYVNQTLWCWKSMVGMTKYLAQLVLTRSFVEKRPLQMISVLLTAASLFYIGKLAVADIKADA